jgi:hypothetical protein
VSGAGEGLSSSRRHRLNVPSPLRRGVLRRLRIQVFSAFHGLRPSLPGSALPRPRPQDGSSNDAAGFTSRYGPLGCTPPRLGRSTLGFDPARFQTKPPACYRAPWRLPGPDFHRQATTSLRNERSTTHMINQSFLLDAPVTDDLHRKAKPLVGRSLDSHQPSPSHLTASNPAILSARGRRPS